MSTVVMQPGGPGGGALVSNKSAPLTDISVPLTKKRTHFRKC